jgi:hypothetical protein
MSRDIVVVVYNSQSQCWLQTARFGCNCQLDPVLHDLTPFGPLPRQITQQATGLLREQSRSVILLLSTSPIVV